MMDLSSLPPKKYKNIRWFVRIPYIATFWILLIISMPAAVLMGIFIWIDYWANCSTASIEENGDIKFKRKSKWIRYPINVAIRPLSLLCYWFMVPVEFLYQYDHKIDGCVIMKIDSWFGEHP